MMQTWLAKANPKLTERTESNGAPDGGLAQKRKADDSLQKDPKRSCTLEAFASKKSPKVYSNKLPAHGPPYLQLERSTMHPSWYWRLTKEFFKPYFAELKKFLEQEKASRCVIYPPENMIYTWAKIPFDMVKVVILGQDPYHNPGQAHGLSFSVVPGVPPPPSLVNIYKEMESDVGVKAPSHGYLAGWARQGVLLLNAVLTVRKNQPASHSKRGWEAITDAVVRCLNEEAEHLVFILWGSHAQKKGSGINRSKHLVLTAVHPSPLSSHRGFFGSKPFSKTNEYLEANGKTPIQWDDLPIDEPPFSIEEFLGSKEMENQEPRQIEKE